VSFTYSIEASNTGAIAADDVTITDQLPPSLAFVSATEPCAFDTGTATVTCDAGTLDVDDRATVEITVTPLEIGTVTNTAVVTPDDQTPDDNRSTVNTDIAAAPVAPEPVPQPVVVTPVFTG